MPDVTIAILATLVIAGVIGLPLLLARLAAPASGNWRFFWAIVAWCVGTIFGLGVYLLAICAIRHRQGFAPATSSAKTVALAPRPLEPQPAERKTCPDCGEPVVAIARICRFCRYEFAPAQRTVAGRKADRTVVGIELAVGWP